MAGSPKKRERRERLATLIGDEEALDWLCACIASGQTLVQFCRERDIPYVAVNEWIQEEEERRTQYRQALEFRDAHHKEVVIGELLQILTVDITQAFTADGTLKPLDQIPEEVRRCIAGLEITEQFDGDDLVIGEIKKVKFWDKNKALELMGKHLKMLTEKHEHTGKDGAPIPIQVVRYPERAPTPEEWAERQKRRQQRQLAQDNAEAQAEGGE